MTFAQFLTIFRARWKVAVGVLFGTIAIAVILSLVLPKKYRAEASIVVDVNPDPINGSLATGLMIPTVIATQLDILQSDRVSRRVIKDLHLDQNPEVREQWQEATHGEGAIEDWLGELFQAQLDIKPSRDSNVIAVGYRAADPKFAAALANAFVQAYIETTVELRVEPARQYSAFFDQRERDARAALQRAQSKASEFQRANGIVAGDERLDVETAKFNELSSQVTMIQTLQNESASHAAQVNSGNADRLNETLNNPVVASVKVDLNRAQANLKELEARLGANNPQVVQARANVDETRARLDAEVRRVSSSVGVSATINNARLADARAQLDVQRLKVLKLKEARDTLTLLQADIDSAQRNFEAITLRKTDSGLESRVQQSNINLLSPAVAPLQPSSPRLVLNVMVAVFLGLLLGLATALLAELRDRRVRNSSDLVQWLGVPVLGVLPNPAARRSKALSHMAQRLVSGRLPAPGKNA